MSSLKKKQSAHNRNDKNTPIIAHFSTTQRHSLHARSTPAPQEKKAPELFTSLHRSMHLRHQQVLASLNSSFAIVSKARKPTLRLITSDVCASKRKGSSDCLLGEDSAILWCDCLCCYAIRNASALACSHIHQV